MPNQTTNLKLNTWNETDVVNFEEINANFEKLDTMVMCIESGTKTAPYTGGYGDSVATWHYKKYSDGTIDMSAKLTYSNLKCDGETSQGIFYSGSSKVTFPFEFRDVFDLQMHMASNSNAWISDINNTSIYNDVTFRLLAMHKETDEIYRQVFINVKGVYV